MLSQALAYCLKTMAECDWGMFPLCRTFVLFLLKIDGMPEYKNKTNQFLFFFLFNIFLTDFKVITYYLQLMNQQFTTSL